MKSKWIYLSFFVATLAQAATLHQYVMIQGATPQQLYAAYLSSEEHTVFTGVPAKITAEKGGSIEAFYNLPDFPGVYAVSGTILELKAGRSEKSVHVIKQEWRNARFKKEEVNSILTLTFRDLSVDGFIGTEIELTQTKVPNRLRAPIDTGWDVHYWRPLQEYVKKKEQ